MRSVCSTLLTAVALSVTGLLAPNRARGQTGDLPATRPTLEQMEERISQLEKEVQEFRARGINTPATLDKHLVDSTVDAVLEDARRRSAVIEADSVHASYTDGRFLLRTSDGNFQFHPWLQFQYRGVANFRSDGKQGGSSDDEENGFEVRRLKFGVDGNAISPNLTYMVQLADDRNSGSIQLEMAWAKYHIDSTPFAFRFGQFKDPLDHEQLLASRTFAPIERSIVNDIFANGENFVKGISLLYEPGDRSFRSEVALTDGMRNFNNDFEDFPKNNADWGVAGRVEYKPFGRWRDYDKLSGESTGEQTFVIGGGADYTEAGDTATLVHVVDGTFLSPKGWMLYGSYLGRYTKDFGIANGGSADTYDPTLRALVSYAIDPHWEPYAEYSFIYFDSAEIGADANQSVHVITVGTAYYIYGHNLKLQVDLSYLPDGSPVNDSGSGILLDNHANEILVRTQVQLLL